MFELDPASALPYRPWRFFWLRQRVPQAALPSGAAHSSFLSEFAVQTGLHVASLAIIALIVVFYRHVVFVNETVVGFTLLLAVLCASAVWGLSVAAVMSIAAAVAYDYFFLPPIGTFNIADARDWAALCSFLVTAAIGSYLSAWARREARTANQRRHETEQLYAFSQHLLGAGDPRQVFEAIPRYVVESFATGPVSLSLADSSDLYSARLDPKQAKRGALEATADHEESPANAEQDIHVVPLRVGQQELGSLRISGPVPSPTALEALGALAVVAIERARAIERTAKMEAARESENLKSVLLDAIAHDFKTPLTSIKGSATALLADLDFGHEERKELLLLIDEECDRINKLIGSASEMSKLDAGQIKLNLAPHSVGELVSASLAGCQGVLRQRKIDLEVKDRECPVLVDLLLASKVLVHLIENANLYCSPGEPITLRAGEQDGRVMLSVSDHGRRSALASASDSTKPFPKEVVAFLQADGLVPVDGMIASLSREQTQGVSDPLQKARRIYDYVTSAVDHDPVGSGSGCGDTLWTAESHRGDCTDFHSLFIGMARAAGIPARLAVGFSIPEGQKQGTIPGYHSWAEFYVSGIGWIPVDVWQASQDPSRRDYFFGALDAHRVMVSMGRDVALTPAPGAGRLNYIAYPYLEADGKPSPVTSMDLFFNAPGFQGAAPTIFRHPIFARALVTVPRLAS